MDSDWEYAQSLSKMVVPDTEEQFSDFSPSKMTFLPVSVALDGRSSAPEREQRSRPRRRPIYRRPRTDLVAVVARRRDVDPRAVEDCGEAKCGASEIEPSGCSRSDIRGIRGKEFLVYRRRSVKTNLVVAEERSLLCDEKWEKMFLPHWDDEDADLLDPVGRSMLKLLLPKLFWVRSCLLFISY